MDFAMILVYILASILALFLLLSVVLVVLLIKVTKQIKNVTSKAEQTAEHFESLAGNLSKGTAPAMIARIILRKLKQKVKS